MATLYLMCGMAESGKTTLAKKLEISREAVRFSPDEWITRLLEDKNDAKESECLRDVVDPLQWETAQRLLSLGMNVVLENGFWGKEEREMYRDTARRLGARVELHYLEVPMEELWRRLDERNENLPEGSFLVTREDLELWLTWFQKPDPEELMTFDNESG